MSDNTTAFVGDMPEYYDRGMGPILLAVQRFRREFGADCSRMPL